MTLRGAAAAAALVYVDFLDELGAGVAPVSAADIRDEFAVAYSGIALMLLVAPLLLSLVVEGPLLLFSDRWKRERVATGCIASMGVAMLVAASASSAWMLALAFGAWGSIGGLGCGLCQGVLMDAYPDERERWMTRWTLMGAIGDSMTPLLIVAATATGIGWRGALAIAGALHLIHALVLSRVRLETTGEGGGDDDDDDEPRGAIWKNLRAALRDRELLLWLGACALCCLLDEILVAFGVLFLRDELGAGVEVQALAFLVAALCGALGLFLTDRLLHRVNPLHLLIATSLATAVVFVLWLFARTIPASVILLGLIGLFCAPLYPICAARAYAARPGQTGLVAALDQLFAPVPLLAPLLIGFVADRSGIVIALAILLLQPLGVAVAAMFARRA
jgi:predicted MFS family arabinose efflux permease